MLESVLLVHQPKTVMMPWGLFHSDHSLAPPGAALILRDRHEEIAWFAYEDALPPLSRLAASALGGIEE